MLDAIRCPYCDSEDVGYRGVDVGGDYDELLVDIWHCGNCDHEFERGCYTFVEDDEVFTYPEYPEWGF